ncbi:hypothetical protein SFMTTN_2906 [Sulfuriferula multivorans]|uniref:Uncharacterized protein n=1 Tax=Sulfuriferula multivorans TaxID=1559896 RepID=A0A401JZJ4_9PROT|nr:hypothetical protein SFMTTN_2906 [Sulfuriferula multivorans]
MLPYDFSQIIESDVIRNPRRRALLKMLELVKSQFTATAVSVTQH